MAATTAGLPLTETVAPTEQAEVAALVRGCYVDGTPVYTLGGQTGMAGGSATKRAGLGLSTTSLARVIDYPARDMTITVEAGMTWANLEATLAAENQCLPVDVAQPDRATLGGVMAANFSGPRRYGYGTLRDYVIGVSAVDGRGTSFKAGGRVVKNVAGYDFCKLLCGSLGTLAVITQITLKLRPKPDAAAMLVYETPDLDRAEELLAALTTTRTTPIALELNVPRDQLPQVIVGFEGTTAEVDWLVAQLDREFAAFDLQPKQTLRNDETTDAWRRLTEFGCTVDGGSLVLKINVRPSRVVEVCKFVGSVVPGASMLARAGSGIILVDCGETTSHDAAKLLIQQLRPAAASAGGQVVVFQTPAPEEWTRQAFWGPTRDDDAVLRAVKRQFDPAGLLNPGRFLF